MASKENSNRSKMKLFWFISFPIFIGLFLILRAFGCDIIHGKWGLLGGLVVLIMLLIWYGLALWGIVLLFNKKYRVMGVCVLIVWLLIHVAFVDIFPAQICVSGRLGPPPDNAEKLEIQR